MINDEIRQAIHNKVSGEELAHLAVRNGMIPLMEDGMEKVRTGITTHAEILRQASVDTGEE
jgi:type IV pilus assembly protein PilB